MNNLGHREGLKFPLSHQTTIYFLAELLVLLLSPLGWTKAWHSFRKRSTCPGVGVFGGSFPWCYRALYASWSLMWWRTAPCHIALKWRVISPCPDSLCNLEAWAFRSSKFHRGPYLFAPFCRRLPPVYEWRRGLPGEAELACWSALWLPQI